MLDYNLFSILFCKQIVISFVSMNRHDYQRVLRYDPMCLPARINLAYTLQVSGRFMQAWRQFTTAIDMKPSKLGKPFPSYDNSAADEFEHNLSNKGKSL